MELILLKTNRKNRKRNNFESADPLEMFGMAGPADGPVSVLLCEAGDKPLFYESCVKGSRLQARETFFDFGCLVSISGCLMNNFRNF